MPVHNRIAIFGFGRLGRLVSHSLIGTDTKNINNRIDFNQLTKVILENKCVSLVDIYNKVKHRYYPETDYFNKLQK